MNAFKTATTAALTAGMLAFAGAPAGAAIFTLTGGTAGSIPGGATNDVLGPLGLAPSLGGFYGAQVSLSGPAKIRVEFIGYEAGAQNTFNLDGQQFSTETDDPTSGDNRETNFSPYPTFITGELSGLLGFSFSTSIDSQTVNNGSNPDNSNDDLANFFASIVGDPDATSGKSVYLFLDDTGASDDDNHDDMVVRLSVVPLPASLPFLLAALAGLGVIARQRRRVAA